MITLKDCKAILTNFKETFGAEYGIKRIGVFGSVAREEQTEDSDVDIVVDVDTPTMSVMYNIQNKLSSIFGCEIDLVRYRESLRPMLKENIEKEAIYV